MIKPCMKKGSYFEGLNVVGKNAVDVTRIVASGIVATLHSNPAFLVQLAKAKAEFAKLQHA